MHSDTYLQTFARSNVTLIDTQGRGLDRISEHAIHFDGNRYEVDCIIYASGFELGVSPGRAGGFPVTGRDGVTLDEHWADRVHSVHGIYTRGFSNLFVIGGARQASVSVNVLLTIGIQAHHAAETIKKLVDRESRSFEITEEAEKRWDTVLAEKSVYNEDAIRSCTPGTFTNEGNFESRNLFADAYGAGPVDYMEVLAQWRRSGLDRDAAIESRDSLPALTSQAS